MFEETGDASDARLLRTGERDSAHHRVEYCGDEGSVDGREYLGAVLATEYGMLPEVSNRQMLTMSGVPKGAWADLAQNFRLFLVKPGVTRACYNPTGPVGTL